MKEGVKTIIVKVLVFHIPIAAADDKRGFQPTSKFNGHPKKGEKAWIQTPSLTLSLNFRALSSFFHDLKFRELTLQNVKIARKFE